ncbi:unnamed protein product [Camellia sinensis]
MVVSSKEESPVYGIKLSSVGPGKVTGQDVVHEPTNMDLAMKLHYLRGVYYFSSQALEGLTITYMKESSFTLLNYFYVACGRFRRSESSGRPYIKCNDCGVRLIEAHCVNTIDEWLEMVKDVDDDDNGDLHKLLSYNQVIGPELPFSPLVLLQITRFKCGGISVGLTWAHVLGDTFSAIDFMNAWGQVMAGHKPAQSLKPDQSHTKIEISSSPLKRSEDPLSVKQVGPVGDHWISPNNCKMEAFSFQLSTKQISQLHSKVCGQVGTKTIPVFQSLCALIWKTIAKIRDGPEPKVVTICKNNPQNGHKNGLLSNGQVVSVVEASFSIMEANLKELAELVINQAMDEQSKIEEAMERDQGLSDFVIYGSNLTFVDLEDVNLYGFELKGQKPVYGTYAIDGVGDEGAVLFLPGPKDGNGGKVVTLIMPQNQVLKLKYELKREFSTA